MSPHLVPPRSDPCLVTEAQQGFQAAPPLCSSSRPQSDVFAHGFRREGAEEGVEEGVEKCVGGDLKKNEVMLGCEGSERGRLPDALGVVPTDAPSTSTSSPTSQVDTAPGVEYGSM